jgi:hypothetical protein
VLQFICENLVTKALSSEPLNLIYNKTDVGFDASLICIEILKVFMLADLVFQALVSRQMMSSALEVSVGARKDIAHLDMFANAVSSSRD